MPDRRSITNFGILRTVEEVSAESGLSIRSVRELAANGDLIRGVDFIVHEWRNGIFRRRKRLFTPVGVEKITHRRYGAIYRRNLASLQRSSAPPSVPPPDGT